MIRQHSRRSFLAAGIGSFALAGIATRAVAHAQSSVGSNSSAGEWVSTRYGDIVTWDDSKMFIHEDISGPGQNFAGEWDKVTLGMHPERTVALAIVRFEELSFHSLEELADAYPQEYWSDELTYRYHPRDAKLTDEAYGFFYREDDVHGIGAHYCGYVEFAPPSEPGGAWSTLEFKTNVNFHEFDFDVMSANGDALEINGNPTFQAWTFEEVLDAFAVEMDVAGV